MYDMEYGSVLPSSILQYGSTKYIGMTTAERTQRQQLVGEIIGSHELEGVVALRSPSVCSIFTHEETSQLMGW